MGRRLKICPKIKCESFFLTYHPNASITIYVSSEKGPARSIGLSVYWKPYQVSAVVLICAKVVWTVTFGTAFIISRYFYCLANSNFFDLFFTAGIFFSAAAECIATWHTYWSVLHTLSAQGFIGPWVRAFIRRKLVRNFSCVAAFSMLQSPCVPASWTILILLLGSLIH